MEEIDRVAARVTYAGCLGALGGCLSAIYKGHVIHRTAALTALSCTMVATACFSSERIANFVAAKILVNNNEEKHIPSFSQIMATHAIGGIVGGAYTSMIYIRRPLQGVLFLTPIMLIVGVTEFTLQEMSERRRLELLNERADATDSSR